MANQKAELKALLYNEAINALERGWTIIPLSASNKKPLAEWKEYQTRSTTSEEVEDWFENGAPTSSGTRVELFNLALVTGAISGVIVLDCDNTEAEAYVKKKGLTTPIAVKTTRGHHYYFAHPMQGKRFANKVGGTAREWVDVQGLDLRGDGGYVVMPPSIKLNEKKDATHQYTWEIAEHHSFDDLSDYVWQGTPTDIVDADQVFSFDTLNLSEISIATVEQSLSVSEQTENRVAILGRKLKDGDGTDGWMVRFCGQMVRKGVVGDNLIQSVTNYYQQFFDPQNYGPKEIQDWLQQKMQSAQGMDRRNYPDDYDEGGVRKDKNAALKETEIVPRSRLVPIYAQAVDGLIANLMDEPFWVDPLIPEATITQVVGFNGHGKSYFMSAMLTSLAAGNQSFGPYEMGKAAKVFYLDYDNPRRTALRRMKEFNTTFGYTNDHFALWSPTLISPEDGGDMDLMSQTGFNLLGEWLDVVNPDVLIIDTIRNAFRGLEEASPTEWAKVNFVAKTVRNKGVSVVLVHHRNKPGEGGLGREAGSTAQLTDIDTQVFVTQVYQDKNDVKAKAGLYDEDLYVHTSDGREFTPYRYLEAQAGNDSRIMMVTQISFGKVRQQTELHQTHYIGWCENLLSGEKFIVSTKSKKQQAIHMSLAQGLNASEISRQMRVPQYEVRRWLGLENC
jgi:hypothetical protein